MPDEDNELDPDDQLAAMRAKMDQAKANVPEMCLWHYTIFQGYMAAGFDEEQAMDFVRIFVMETAS